MDRTATFVYSGTNNQLAGQGQHELINGFQAAPAFEPTPVAEQGAMIATAQPVQPENGVQVAGDSHYRYADGMWFYQLANNSWVRWENGGWHEYNANAIASENSGAVPRVSSLTSPRRTARGRRMPTMGRTWTTARRLTKTRRSRHSKSRTSKNRRMPWRGCRPEQQPK